MVAPPASHVKLNCDTANFKMTGNGLGFVIRNDKGEVLMSSMKRIPSQLDIESAEAQSLLFGLTSALDGGSHSIIAESNSSILIKKLQLSSPQRSYFSTLVMVIKPLQSSCSSLSFKHAFRSANTVAHHLARTFKYISYPVTLMEDVPPNILDLVLYGQSLLSFS